MAVIDETKYIKLVEIRKIVGKVIWTKTFEKLFPEYPLVKVSDTYCFAYDGNRTEVIRQISQVFMEHYLQQSIADPYEKVEYYLNRYDDIVHKKYPVLFDTYKDFVHEKITNSKQVKKNLMQMIGTYMNLFRYLIRFMDELALKYKADSFDVNSLTEIDVRKIITSKDVPVTYIKNFGYYLTYLKENKNLDIEEEIAILSFNEEGKKVYVSATVFDNCFFWHGHDGTPLLEMKDDIVQILDIRDDKNILDIYIEMIDKCDKYKSKQNKGNIGKAIYNKVIL